MEAEKCTFFPQEKIFAAHGTQTEQSGHSPVFLLLHTMDTNISSRLIHTQVVYGRMLPMYVCFYDIFKCIRASFRGGAFAHLMAVLLVLISITLTEILK